MCPVGNLEPQAQTATLYLSKRARALEPALFNNLPIIWRASLFSLRFKVTAGMVSPKCHLGIFMVLTPFHDLDHSSIGDISEHHRFQEVWLVTNLEEILKNRLDPAGISRG